MKLVNTQRSTALNKLQHHMPVILSDEGIDIDPKLFVASAGPERGDSDVLKSLLSFTDAEPYPLLAPMMFRGHINTPENLFLNVIGPKVGIVLCPNHLFIH